MSRRLRYHVIEQRGTVQVPLLEPPPARMWEGLDSVAQARFRDATLFLGMDSATGRGKMVYVTDGDCVEFRFGGVEDFLALLDTIPGVDDAILWTCSVWRDRRPQDGWRFPERLSKTVEIGKWCDASTWQLRLLEDQLGEDRRG